jgi:hypothetical protein
MDKWDIQLMTVAFDPDQLEIVERSSARAKPAKVARWLANQWPKAAITFGFALTIVWTAVLAWLLARVVGLV